MKTLNKNDIIELSITDLGAEGEGIGRIDGIPLFVKGAVTGDVIEARIMKMKKTFGYARVEKILTASPWRIVPPCPVAQPCGGCQLQHLTYEKQLEYKQNKVENCLQRIGGLKEIPIEPIAGMKEPFHYRNKSQFPVGKDKEGETVIGFYAGRTHSIIDTRSCMIQHPALSPVLDVIRSFLEEFRISSYEEETGKGLVRHIMLRVGAASKEVMVCLVVNGTKLPKSEVLVQRLGGMEYVVGMDTGMDTRNTESQEETGFATDSREQRVYKITSISLNVNKENTNVILGQQMIPLYGPLYITDSIGDIQYRISPLSFYQVNPVQTKVLYDTALEFAGLTGTETVWDLYCGIGTISLFLAQKAKMVYGVEIVPEAILDAKENAALNGIQNVEFMTGAAEDVLPAFYNSSRSKGEAKASSKVADKKEAEDTLAEGTVMDYLGEGDRGNASKLHPEVIVVDPPRKGCDETLLQTMVEMQPERIVYVSCDPATLARDVKYLGEHGYEVKRVKAVDMFPQTVHVETCCLLSRKVPV